MQKLTELPMLRVGLIGSGFIAAFHLQSMVGVRNVSIGGVYSRSVERRTRIAEKARSLGLGQAHAFDSIEAMAMSGEVDALWLLTPNDTRLDIMREIHRLTKAGAPLRAVACEKPLARTLAEAREMLALVEDAALLHGYLENQLFSTAVMRGKDIIWRRAVPQGGRPYLARAAEEHSGPHEPWFWQGERQGGGVLSDMMCHSVEVARFMLTAPGATRDTLRLVSASATTANLKWTRPRYAADLRTRMGIDFAKRPVEDFARGILAMEDADGYQLMIEATTSWAYVGAGLRIQLELLGPEYSMEFSSLSTGLKVFLSRAVTGSEGEDLVEKRHMVEAFRRGLSPAETFHDGVGVMEMLMGLYRSAELGQTIHFPDPELEHYVPSVAR